MGTGKSSREEDNAPLRCLMQRVHRHVLGLKCAFRSLSRIHLMYKVFGSVPMFRLSTIDYRNRGRITVMRLKKKDSPVLSKGGGCNDWDL